MPPQAGPHSAAPAGLPRAPTERQVFCFSPQALHKPQEETGVTVNSICVLWKEHSLILFTFLLAASAWGVAAPC